jgi:hypothetical protein
MIFDTNPELKAMGKKTTTITKVIDVTVPPISAVPSCCTDAVFPFPCAYIYFQNYNGIIDEIPTTSDKPTNSLSLRCSLKDIFL